MLKDIESIYNRYFGKWGSASTPQKMQYCNGRGCSCKDNPGWFGPGEIVEAAGYLNLNIEDFIKEYIVIESIYNPQYGIIDVYAPVKVDRYGKPNWPTATRVDGFYDFFRGPCIFYKDNDCEIYPVRPVECRNGSCGQNSL